MTSALILSLLLLFLPTRQAQLPPELLQLTRYQVHNARSRAAVCNDGTPAVYYFRDCPRPGQECQINPGGDQWVVVFEGGESSSVCFDTASCAARAARHPSLTSSKQAPSSFSYSSLEGIFSDSGEGNPNFYEQRIVWVPYCSSDMWLGDSTHNNNNTNTNTSITFRGRSIVKAVVEDLLSTTFSKHSVPTPYGPGPNMTSIRNAARVVIVGNAGVVRWLDDIAEQIVAASNTADVRVLGICDGCVIASDVRPFVSTKKVPCDALDTSTCPPTYLLEQYADAPTWNFQYPPDHGRPHDYTSLLSASLLSSTKTPLMVQHPQFDRQQLKQLRCCGDTWPPAAGTVEEKYALAFAQSIRDTMEKQYTNTGMFTFAPACSGNPPSSLSTNNTLENVVASGLLSPNPFFCTPINDCVLLGENSTETSVSFAAATSMFLNVPQVQFEPRCIEQCVGVDCNTYCNAPKCFRL